jgi:1,4-dihydroxy-2-naphthoate octaprenyltransferase
MSEAATGSAPARGGLGSLVRNWTTIINTANPAPDAPMDPVSKWLIITRASVFSMTITSGLIGGLLAAQTDDVSISWWFFALAMAWPVLAHAANNMINDYFDTTGGAMTRSTRARSTCRTRCSPT